MTASATARRKGSRGMSGHHRPVGGGTVEWLTPPHIIADLGPFDLDPCTPAEMPWNTATTRYTPGDDGLASPWAGRVWLNPPYGPDTWEWLSRLADHGDGIALVFARTETAGFFRHVWGRADALRFIEGRLHFHYPDGARAPFNAGAPSVLVAYGGRNAEALRRSSVPGAFVRLRDGGA